MGQRDLAQNDYLNDKRRFADMCNGIMFHGNDIIKPEELQETREEVVYREDVGRRKIIPDKVFRWSGIYLAIISVENQTMVDYRMVFRMMKEVAVTYERQWNERESEYQRTGIVGKDSHLCWIGKGEKFIPVIPIVIYYGTDKPWDGATCLYDMLDMDKSLEPYITNYKFNLFDYHECIDLSIFKTENRELFEVLSCAKNENEMDALIRGNERRYKELPYDAAQTICDIAGVDIALIKKVKEDESEVACMCKAWDDHKESGRKEGLEQGIRIFVEDRVGDGETEEEIVGRLVLRFQLDKDKAYGYYQKYRVS